MSDLVERLGKGRVAYTSAAGPIHEGADSLHAEAAAELTRLRSEVERLTRERDEAQAAAEVSVDALVARETRILSDKLTTLTARTREVLAPFAAARVPYDFAADDEPVSLPIPGGAYRAANTLFNELKEKSNG